MAKIESIYFQAQLLFHDNDVIRFKFPINNPIRISFKPLGANHSLPCEISSDEPIHKNKTVEVQIMIPMSDLDGQIVEQKEFYIGTFPIIVGKGKILKIISAAK